MNNYQNTLNDASALLHAQLQDAGVQIAHNAPIATLVRVARNSSDPGVWYALAQFETSIRPPLEALVCSVPKKAISKLPPSSRFLISHFRSHSDAPVDPNLLRRMVICAHRIYRSARRGAAND